MDFESLNWPRHKILTAEVWQSWTCIWTSGHQLTTRFSQLNKLPSEEVCRKSHLQVQEDQPIKKWTFVRFRLSSHHDQFPQYQLFLSLDRDGTQWLLPQGYSVCFVGLPPLCNTFWVLPWSSPVLAHFLLCYSGNFPNCLFGLEVLTRRKTWVEPFQYHMVPNPSPLVH